MSITDELREWAKGSTLSSWTAEHLTAIADRIDAEHEKAMSRAGQLLADAEKDRDYNYANWQDCKQRVLQGNITFGELNAKIAHLMDELSHRIEPPKDADNVPIHVGDVMEWIDLDGKVSLVFTVEAVGTDCFFAWDKSTGRFVQKEASAYRHYHAPTVEDVLHEFICDHEEGVRDEVDLIAEYAAKLRLAEGEDA